MYVLKIDITEDCASTDNDQRSVDFILKGQKQNE